MKRYLAPIAVVLVAVAGLGAVSQKEKISRLSPQRQSIDRTVTVADDAGLQKAIREARGSTRIHLQPGRYSELSVVRIADGASLTIEGAQNPHLVTVGALNVAAKGGTIIRNLRVARPAGTAPSQYLGFIRNSDDVTLENLIFESPLSETERGREYGLMIRTSSNVRVRDSHFSGMRYGIGFLRVRDVAIEGNEFFGLQTDGVRGGGIDGLIVRANVLGHFTPKSGEHPDGIQLWSTNQSKPGRRITIRDNLILRDGGGIVQGIFVRDTHNKLPFEQVDVSGNMVIGGMYNGIAISGAHGLVMTDNQVIAFPDQKSWISFNNVVDGNVERNRAMIFIKDRKIWSKRGSNRINHPVRAVKAETVREWIKQRGLSDMTSRPYLASYLRRLEQ